MNLSQLPQWIQTAGIVLGAIYAIATVVSGLFATLAGLFPGVAFFTRAAGIVGTIGVDLQKVLALLGKNGGGKAMGFVLCLALATSTTGCAALSHWWGGGGEQQALTLAERIAADALKGMSLVDIAKDLGVAILDVVEAILKDPHLTGTAAQHEAVSLRNAMLGVGCAP